MSASYWSACSGTGLLLGHSEFETMIEKYKSLNPREAEAVSEAFSDDSVDGLRLIPARIAGTAFADFMHDTNPEIKSIAVTFTEVNDDYADGAEIWPFYRPDGSMNVVDAGHPEKLCNDAMGQYNVCYVCWSRKSMSDAAAFKQKPYASYQEFKNEFVEQLGKYLPDDFDWDAHLGYISYAVYA